MGKTLFGTDGVRGIAGDYPLQKELIRKLGASAASIYREHTGKRGKVFFLLGRDTRGSGPWIANAFAEGAGSQGVVLHDLGVISTPSLAHLVPKRKALGGVMISASHNPAAFNGIKLFGPDGRKCPDAWEIEIEAHLEALSTLTPKKAPVKKDSAGLVNYLSFLRATLPKGFSLKGMTLVIDCGNGSMSKIAPAFLRKLGARIISLGTTPNGKNINAGVGSQHPDKMQKLVVQKRAHGGIAFDGDADRAIFCDENGRLLDGDFVLACAARLMKNHNRLKGDTVVVTVMANLGLLKALESWGLKTVATAVGDRYVSDALELHDAVLGGEQSGHVIFRKHLPTGDGLLTALQILALLRSGNHSFSWMGNLFKKYPQVLKNVAVKDKTPIEQCPTIHSRILAAEKTLGDHGRVVVRYSGTEPLLRIMMEGPDKGQLETLVDAIATQAKARLG